MLKDLCVPTYLSYQEIRFFGLKSDFFMPILLKNYEPFFAKNQYCLLINIL